MDWIEKEMQKLQILKRDGILGEASFIAKQEFLRQHGKPAQGGVGMLLSDTAPFKVLQLTPGGPAERTQHIRVNDILVSVDGMNMTRVSGDQVREAIIGPAGSVVELTFQEVPKRTQHGAYAVKIKRAEPNNGGNTQIGRGPPSSLGSQEMRYVDDLDQFSETSERAVKHHYDPKKGLWQRTMIMVSVETTPFSSGAMRDAYKMKDLTQTGDESQYVMKMSKDPREDTQIYYEDVKMQMEAKMYADMYNQCNVPKKVDFLAAYVLELVERQGRPICGVEKYIAGEYKKYNNNWDWSDDKRNTPQAFSHFTLERSNRQLLICDIQGVGDLWTDPQIHSANDQGYGKGNMGPRGIETFLKNHKCNVICQHLGLPSTGQVKKKHQYETMVLSPDQMTMIRNTGGLAPATTGAAAGGGGGQQQGRAAQSDPESERRKRELEARERELERKERELREREEGARKREKDLAERMKREIERERNESGQAARDVAELQGMGFSRALAEQAMQHASDLHEAVDWCIAQQAAQQQNQQPAAARTKRSIIETKSKNRLVKELDAIKKGASNEEQVFLTPREGDNGNLLVWDVVIIGPNATPYEGGAFQLEMEVPEDYPMNPPKVKFKTPVYHPNVWCRNDERFGEICIDILSTAWSPATRLKGLVQSLQSLLDDPAADTALDPIIGKVCREKPAEFQDFARSWTRQYAFDSNQTRKMCQMGYPVDRILKALRNNPSNLDQALAEVLMGEEGGGGGGGSNSVSSAGSGGGRRMPPGYDQAAGGGNSPNHQAQRLAQQQAVAQRLQSMQQQQQHAQPLPSYEQAVQELPPGWSSHKDPSTGRTYYYNRSTNTTQWEVPRPGR